jgi:hypothetical protein
MQFDLDMPCDILGMLICMLLVVYLSWVFHVIISSLWMVLFVFSAILRLVFLKRFVINLVSLPVYVKKTHLCVALSV